MRWMEVTIETTEDASDAICEMLAQLGADGIAVSDPDEIRRIIEDPNSLAYADDGFVDSLGQDVVIRAYFAEFAEGIRLGAKSDEYQNPDGIGELYARIATGTVSAERVREIVGERLSDIGQFLPTGKGVVSHRYVEEEDWANSWKKYYSVLKISPRVVICPSWEEYTPAPSEVVISLDPGSAFGTGTHETTSMCAEIIDRIVTAEDTVLDLGCGSGILAIIADKLGASSVEAVDIDRLAVQVAVENITRNQGRIDCHAGELKDAKSKSYSLIVANIIADVLIMLSKDFADYLSPEGRILISGIIETKSEAVRDAMTAAGFRMIGCHMKGDWRAYLYDRASGEDIAACEAF